MKAVIISFVLYLLYDAYIRKRDADLYVKKDEFLKAIENSSLRHYKRVEWETDMFKACKPDVPMHFTLNEKTYFWDGVKLHWNASIVNENQPTLV